jgi:hypothetical protein
MLSAVIQIKTKWRTKEKKAKTVLFKLSLLFPLKILKKDQRVIDASRLNDQIVIPLLSPLL